MKKTECVIILELNQFPPINAGLHMLGQKHKICSSALRQHSDRWGNESLPYSVFQ